MKFEDELRETMRAHDHEAPRLASLPERPWTRRRTWLPIAAAAAAVVVVALGVVALTQTRTHHAQPSSAVPNCPSSYETKSLGGTWVPAAPRGVDGKARLVPNETPNDVTVCAYLGADKGALTGSRNVTGDLDAVTETLAWLPTGNSDSKICDAVLLPEDGDHYLIGLTYPAGEVWVSAPGNHCDGASNGVFQTFANLRSFADAAYRTGTWDLNPKPSLEVPPRDPCRMSIFGRLGQDQQLVPDSPTDVMICARTGTHISSRTSTNPSQLAAALDKLQPQAMSPVSECPAGAPNTTYELRFRYSQGTDVLVDVSPGCQPSIDNSSLQSDDSSTIVPLIEQLLGQPK